MKYLTSVVLLLVVMASSNAAQRLNVLLIIADDCTYTDLGVYGGQSKTPNLDKLAQEGMTFLRCYQAAPMCSPTRHSLYTGIYPVKSGAYPNHTMAYPWVKSIASYMQPLGVQCYLSGKTHIGPKSVFPFEYSNRKGFGNNPDPKALTSAIETSTKTGKPFIFIAASNEPHSPWNRGDASAYPPSTLKLPPIWVDTPETREGYSHYLAEVTYFDSQVGELIQILDESKQRDNTMVIVLSEQGNSFPFAKWTCYDAGIHSGCIIRCPGMIKAGTISNALIEYVDIVPTIMDAMDGPATTAIDGKSFLNVLQGKTSAHKKYAFALQTSRGINNGPKQFGIRSVHDGRYLYLRNLTPGITFTNASTQGAIWESWVAAPTSTAKTLVHDYQHRPAEELYDCQTDPWNRTNLIDSEELSMKRDQLRQQLDQWMKSQGDKGALTELKALERMPKHGPKE